MKVEYCATLPMYKHWISIVGSTDPQGWSVTIRSIAIQELSINGAREESTGSKTMISSRDASAVATSGLRRSLAFWAMTRRYLRIPRIPSTVAVMAIANGGRSCDIKGVSSPQSSIAAASVGIWAVPWNCTSLRLVCDKVVCEGWSVTVCERWCVKDGVWKMVCDKVVCEMVCDKVVCVKEGVSKMVCERWSVTTWCVTDGVWQSGVCERWCVEDGGSKCPARASPVPSVPRLPRQTKVDVIKCHACHAKVPRRPGRLKPAQARHPVP